MNIKLFKTNYLTLVAGTEVGAAARKQDVLSRRP